MWDKCCEKAVCEAKEYTQSDLNRAKAEVSEPLKKQISELQAQNLKLKLAIRTIADAMTPFADLEATFFNERNE